jgi:hypothetical protein
VDWSLVDDQGQPVSIRGLSVAELQSVLDNLTPETFGEIREAIERHEEAMTAEREAEKKTTPGAPASPSTSPSPSAAAGVLIGSEP